MSGMWMGPRGGECWVPAPAVGNDFTGVGWSGKSQYLNGGAGIRRSQGSHMEYTLAWNTTSRDKVRPVRDMYSGKRGPGLIYFIDPMAADKNVLPESWAWPALACYDAVPIIGDVRPSKTTTSGNNLDYPMESCTYQLTGTSRSLYLPIPPGFTAWVGVHGSTNGWGGVRVRETSGATGYGAESYPVFQSVTDAKRFSESHTGCTGIEIDLAASATNPWTSNVLMTSPDLYTSTTLYTNGGVGGNFTAGATSIVLSGLMVQILPNGVTPEAGDFISGQGHSGCDFEQAPVQTAYSAVLSNAEVGMTAKLTETGDFL